MKGSAMPPGSGARNGGISALKARRTLVNPSSPAGSVDTDQKRSVFFASTVTFRSVSSPVESVALAAGFPAGSRTTAFPDPP